MQRVLVTAGASGIGYALAEAFYAEGYKVWIIDVSENDLKKCPKNWKQTKLDVSDENAMGDLFSTINNEWGGLDVLCANAGTAGATELIEDQDLLAFRKCLDVNLIGAFLSVKGCLPMMKKQGKGAIIFTSSTAGLYGFPYRSPYSASKWAIHGLMKTVAMEAVHLAYVQMLLRLAALRAIELMVLLKGKLLKKTQHQILYGKHTKLVHL